MSSRFSLPRICAGLERQEEWQRGHVSKRAIALALVICTTGGRALAIPAFARRYQTACTTCHVLPPQLNSQGQAFRANGFRMPSGEGSRQDADVQLGAPEWEGLFPNAFSPERSRTPRRSRVSCTPPWERSTARSGRRDDADPGLLSAGNLGRRASWFAAVDSGPEGAAIERMWLSFDRLAGPGDARLKARGRAAPAVRHNLSY